MPCSSRRATRLCSIEAIQEFQKGLKTAPRLAPVRYQRALAILQAGSPQQGEDGAEGDRDPRPNFADAVLLLADLNIKSARAPPAACLPGARPAGLGLSRPARACAGHGGVPATRHPAPKDPRAVYLLGVGLLAQGQRAQARKEFEAGLALG